MWQVSVALRALLATVTTSQVFRWYLWLSCAGSLVLMSVSRLHAVWYGPLWIFKGMLLCGGNVTLVSEACRRMHVRVTAAGFLLCSFIALAIHIALMRPEKWPGSVLETAFSVMAGCSSLLALITGLAIIMRKSNNGLAWSLTLWGYLLLDALNLYPASVYIESVGISIGVATSACYVAWIVIEISERLSRRPKRLFLPGRLQLRSQ